MVSCCTCDLVMMTWDLDAPMGCRVAVGGLLLWPVNTGTVLMLERSSLLIGNVVICRRGLLLVVVAGQLLLAVNDICAYGGTQLQLDCCDEVGLVPIVDWL